MSFEKAGSGPGEGIFPSLRRVRVRFTEQADAGDPMQFDFLNFGDTTVGLGALGFGQGGDPGADVMNTVRVADASSSNCRLLEAGFYGLAEETQAAGTDGWLHIRGDFLNAIPPASTVQSDMLVAAAGGWARATGTASGAKVLAIASEDLSATTTGFCRVLFNGIEGFGNDA